jgi:hypothetical protein
LVSQIPQYLPVAGFFSSIEGFKELVWERKDKLKY